MEQPSSVSSIGYYDVFLSFRGEDVRKNFVDHLYRAMERSGIYAFKDDEKLERGKSISPALKKAIEESSIAVVVFSDHYADSTWCLEELVTITECIELKGQIVVPVFYGVDPSTVRKQKGKYGEAFAGHEKRFENDGEQRSEKWRKVLEDVANLSGWDLDNTENGHEAKFIERIVEDVIAKLGRTWSSDDPNLIGMKLRMQTLYPLIGLGSSDVRFVGIFGMSGIGKTTIARCIYDEISSKFEGYSFIHEVKEQSAKHGFVHLQQKLLSEVLSIQDLKVKHVFEGTNMIKRRLRYKRVLIVLDDVDHMDQLESLARNCDWFGIGSRIIITTKDKHLLIGHKVNSLRLYKMGLLYEGESFQLFRKFAFKKHVPPTKEFEELETQVVDYAGGLPLALRVFGSFLYGRDIPEWRSELDRLREIPENEIIDKLKGSFYGLNTNAQKIFLDIAYFFNGKKKACIRKKLDSFNFHSIIGINVLREKCLITVSNGRVWMHQMIQEMGRDVVRQEASNDPKRYSRLWLPQDISQLLTGNQGTERIEGIALNLREATNVKVNSEAFIHMTKLRLLKFHNANTSQVPNFLPSELRWLDWHGYPLKCFPASFQGENLVGVKMQYSRVIQLWKGSKVLDNLKLINLSHSHKLIRTPNFSGVPNLERLVLKDCTSLVEIHTSVGFLRNLFLLNLKGCINLKSLPKVIHLEKLETLIISGCWKLENFPKIAGPMACLLEVHAEATSLRELPSSIEYLTCLSFIDLCNCKHFASLPISICRLKGLKTLILSGCSMLDKLPDELGQMECLEELFCDDTAIQELPSSISLLKKLKMLTFRGCKPLASRSQRSFFVSRLLPITFQDIKTSPCFSLSGLSSLVQLDISGCSMFDGGFSCDLGELPSLEVLNLSNNKFVGIPAESLAHLTRLRKLDLVGCDKLETLPELPLSIKEVYIDECNALKGNIDMFTKYPKLSHISFTNCVHLLQDGHYNHMVDAIWQHLLKGLSMDDRHFSIFFPGTWVPEWFTYKNLGPSISVNLPQNWYNNKFMGFAICVPDVRSITCCLVSKDVINKYEVEVIFGYRNHDGSEQHRLIFIGVIGTEQYVVSERTCLAYLSYRCLSLENPEYQNPNEWSQIEVWGYYEHERTSDYGLHLVYEDDVKLAEELLLPMIQN